MNMDEIRYFLSTYENRSMSKAASELYISPQGLSRSLRRLEAKLGVRLFVRTSQGMMPTEQATHLKGVFQKMADAEDEAYSYLAGLKRAQRTRFLLGRDSMLGDVICRGVDDYNESHPDTPVESVMMRETEDRLAKVFLEGGYDYRFLSRELDPLSDLPEADLCPYLFIPLVNKESPIAMRGGGVNTDDFRDLVVLAEYSHFNWVKILEKRCQKAGFELKMREVDKEYIMRLLSRPGKEIVFMRQFDRTLPFWSSDQFVSPPMAEPLVSKIVLQTTHSQLDSELVNCIRSRLLDSPYGTDPF